MSQEDSSELQEVRARISFGLDVQQFMNAPIGKYLTRRANAVIEAAQIALGTVDAEDPKAIRAQQQKIAAASYFLEWMGEAVTEGEQAEQSFINQETQQG